MAGDLIWFPTGFDARGIVWAQTDAAHLTQTSFLFGDVFKGRPVSHAPLGGHPSKGELPGVNGLRRYIFHTAFCCSTLLARSLSFRGRFLDLKEPDILMQAANLERNQPGRTMAVLPTVEAGLFSLDAPVIVKPTNAANRMAPALMASEQARAIIIHSDLESFVLSIARKGEEGRGFGRRLYNILQMDDAFAAQLPARDVFTLTDLQIAGFVWVMQCAQLNAAIAAAPGKYRTLHADVFLAAPDRALEAAARFLELPVTAEEISAVADSDLFRRDSKFPEQGYDAELRKEDRRLAAAAFADSLAFVKTWLDKLPHPKAIRGQELLP